MSDGGYISPTLTDLWLLSLQIFFLAHFFFPPLWLQLFCYIVCYCPTNLTCSVFFFFVFQYGLFLLTCPWIHSFFLFWVQSTDKHIKWILHFCYHGFHFCFFYLGLFKNDFHASDKIHFLIYLCWLFFLLLFNIHQSYLKVLVW